MRYRKVKIAGKTKYAHRVVVEKRIGRALGRNEIVHHDNENRLDNADANLILTTPKDHARHHMLKYPLKRVCEVCGTVFEPKTGKRNRDRSCSWICRSTLISEARSGVLILPSLLAQLLELRAAGVSLRRAEHVMGAPRITLARLLAGRLRVRDPDAVACAVAQQLQATLELRGER